MGEKFGREGIVEVVSVKDDTRYSVRIGDDWISLKGTPKCKKGNKVKVGG